MEQTKSKERQTEKDSTSNFKTRKTTEYFTEQRDIGDTGWSESEKYTATTEAAVKTVQQEKGAVEEEDVSITIFIFSDDLGMCSKRLTETDREYGIQTGSKDFSNSNFSKSTRFYEGEMTPRTRRDSYFQTILRLTKKAICKNRLC